MCCCWLFVCTVHFIIQYISKSKGKVLKIKEKEGRFEIPTLKKATRVSKDKDEDQEMVKLKKVPKPQEEEYKESPRVYAEAHTEVIITESYEAEMHFETFETIKRVEKIQPEVDKKRPVEPDQASPQIKPESEVEEKAKKTTIGKVPKKDTPEEPGLALKKVKKLPLDTKEQESVKLKPFEKPVKPPAETEKDTKKDEKGREPITFDRSREPVTFQKGERPEKDEKPKELDVLTKKEEPSIPDKKEPDEVAVKAVTRPPKDEAPSEPTEKLFKGKGKIPSKDQEPEKVQLKPFTKKPSAGSPKEKEVLEPKEQKPIELSPLSRAPKDDIKKEPSIPPKRVDSQETPDKGKEVQKIPTIVPVEDKKILPKKVTPVKEITPKEDEKKPIVTKKGILPKEAEKKEDIILKPVERAKGGVEPEKIPSPKVEKPKPTESVPMERKPSEDLAKKPKKVSPKDSIEAVILKKVPSEVSPEEDKYEETPISEVEEIPVLKELSPGAVQLRKVSTQIEEEVFEEEVEVEYEAEDEDEAWGWEVASRDSYGSEGSEERYLEEGALETPGMPGGRRGERVAVNYTNECLIFHAMETSPLFIFSPDNFHVYIHVHPHKTAKSCLPPSSSSSIFIVACVLYFNVFSSCLLFMCVSSLINEI